MDEGRVNSNIRYEPDDNPPIAVTIGAGFQGAMIIVAPVVLTVVIVVRVAEQADDYLTWAVFAALLICGITTIIQGLRIGPIGSGHVLIMGTSGVFIAVCVGALAGAGPSTLASLVVVSSLIQFLLAARLSLLRRIFTPVVSGTVIMLIPVTVFSLVFDILKDVPEDAPAYAAPTAALVTLVAIIVMVLRAPPRLRLWSLVVGIVAGCVASAAVGIYDVQQVLDAAWVGVPLGGWPGFDFTPGPVFWGLLPAFIVVTLVGAVETIGDGVAIQRVSRRRPRATDFRVVQGALNADGLGNLLSGVAGTLPNTTYSSSISLADVTGIAARRVGVALGLIFIALAFLPKFAALLVVIPGPVAGTFILVLLAILFVQGMKIIVQDGIDYRKATIVGTAFWMGVGFQNEAIFRDILGDGFLGVLLGNGMTSGALVAVIMMLFMNLTGSRPRRMQVQMNADAFPRLDEFLRAFASRHRWNAGSTDRLLLVGEETLTSLMSQDDEDSAPRERRRLALTARIDGQGAELEFVSGEEGENLEDRLAYLGETPDIADEREMSFRLLRHYASSVRHQKYHGVDIVTVNVEGSR